MKSNRFGVIIIVVLTAWSILLAIISPRFLKEKNTRITGNNEKINNSVVAAKGVVESEEEIEISSQAVGIISEVIANECDLVKKGQTLVIFDDQKIKARVNLAEAMLREAKARLKELKAGYRKEDIEAAQSGVNRSEIIYEKARDEYERQKRLYQKEATTWVNLERAEEKMRVAVEELSGVRSNLKKLLAGMRKEEIEQAESAVEKAISELNYYQALLKDYRILSPIDGLVVERYRNPGESVNTGTPLLRLINPKKLRIRAEIEETDMGKVMEGQLVEVFTDAYKGKVYRGKVYQVFPILRKYSLRTFDPSAAYDVNAQDIYLKLDDFSGFKNGMLVTVRFLK